MSADLPDSKTAPPSLRPTRPRAASFATGLLVGATLVLALLLGFAPPMLALIGAVPCSLIGGAGCVLLGRLNLPGPGGAEPWRLDAWALSVGGLSLLALGLSVGPQTKPLGWLLVAMMVSLSLAGFGAGRAR